MSKTRTAAPGDIFRHFKNRLYQIVTVAYHSETGERLVIYQALYGDYRVYARPYEMFMSEVDRVKYPDAEQQYRFEKVTVSEGGGSEKPTGDISVSVAVSDTEKAADVTETADVTEAAKEAPDGVNPCLLEFFDRDGCKQKIEYLNSIRNKIDDKLISDIAVSMDFTVDEGTLDERLNSLLYCLQTKARFECGRLR